MRLARMAALAWLLIFVVGAQGWAQEAKATPLTGTWQCQSHGGPQGDTPFTLNLEQDGEKVQGSVNSPMGGTDITSATFTKDVLEIHLDTEDGKYVLKATLKDGQLVDGEITHDGNKQGTWEGKKGST